MEAGEAGEEKLDKTKLFFFNLFPPRDGMIAAWVNTVRPSVSSDCNHTDQS